MHKVCQNKIYVGNIQTNASDEQVKDLLSCIGPLIHWEAKREGEVKFSAIAEYPDEYLALIAVKQLNGYKFQNRELKVKLYGDSINQMIQLSDNKDIVRTFELDKITSSTIDSFFNQLTLDQKYELLYELKLQFENRPSQLMELLNSKPLFAKHIQKIQEDIFKIYPKKNNTIQNNMLQNQQTRIQQQQQDFRRIHNQIPTQHIPIPATNLQGFQQPPNYFPNFPLNAEPFPQYQFQQQQFHYLNRQPPQQYIPRQFDYNKK